MVDTCLQLCDHHIFMTTKLSGGICQALPSGPLAISIGLSENIFIQLIRNDKRKCQKKTMWALICLILVHKVYSIATDSFDVTLVYEDSKYNQAHKVVLATSSA